VLAGVDRKKILEWIGAAKPKLSPQELFRVGASKKIRITLIDVITKNGSPVFV